MTFPKIQSVNFFTDFPIFFDGSFQILMIGKGLKSLKRWHTVVLPLHKFDGKSKYWCVKTSLLLGLSYSALFQDIAFQRGYWPWGMFRELGCIFVENCFGFYGCDGK